MIKISNLHLFSVAVIAVVCFVGTTTSVFAANHLVTPLVLNFNLEKRDIITEYITLTNTSERMVRVYASVNNVAMEGGVVESFEQKVVADKGTTATTWIEISRQRMELKPGEVREVPFTIRMNPLTEPGDYNVFIGFAEGSNRPNAASKVAQGLAPGTIVHISVDQTQDQFLRLEKFDVDRFVTATDGETMLFTLTNPGGVDIIPSGEVIFYNNKGVEVDSLPVNVQQSKVPADGEASFSMDVPDALTLGKYKAFLSVEYGEHLTASVHDTAFFYIMPLKQLIIIFFIILVLTILIALYAHRRYDGGGDVGDGSENVAMYVREGTSDNQDHDLDLSKNDEA
ncbi:MAG: hypothetical protein ACI92I_000032 [Acidimicrobiales bacterium]|jgi:hypothetical protein